MILFWALKNCQNLFLFQVFGFFFSSSFLKKSKNTFGVFKSFFDTKNVLKQSDVKPTLL